MIYLQLFLTFLKIGLVSFGGGYGMISLMRDDCLSNGWLTEGEILNFIAIAESTPGPIAVNMATFVGSSQGGLAGAFLATLGVVLPSFVIIMLIASVFTRLLQYAGIKAVLGGIRPAIVAMIMGTATTMLLSICFGFRAISDNAVTDIRAISILGIIALVAFCYKRWKKTHVSPIVLIIISGVLGIILY